MELTWFGWLFILYYLINASLDIALIVKAWTITPAVAISQLSTYGLLIWGAVTVGVTR